MPEVGGKKLAGDFSGMMADLRKSVDAAKETVHSAVVELKTEIESGAASAVKALRDEANEVRKGFGELLGNGPPIEITKEHPTETK